VSPLLAVAAIENPQTSCGAALVPHYAGALLALLAFAATAPDVTRLFANRLWQATLQRLLRLRGWVARWIPALRRDATVHAVTARGVTVIPAVEASGTVHVAWSSGGTIEEQLEAVRQRIDGLERTAADLSAAVRKIQREAGRALAEATETLRQEISGVHAALDARDYKTADLNARGLPIILLTVTLGAVPEAVWCGWSWPWAWLAGLACLGFAVIRTLDIWRGQGRPTD
jgi:hypothetical protein